MKKSQALSSEAPFHIVITGGGTGGHVYPGIAVAKELRRQIPSASVMFIGTRAGLESKIVPYEGFPLETIEIQGFKGKGLIRKLRTLQALPAAILRARKLLKGFRPAVVFGTGGYVSVPVIYAAYLLRIPTLLLEPNRKPGLANSLLSKCVNHIAISFQESMTSFPQEKVLFTGNPIRKEFYLIGRTPPPDKGMKRNILIIGGSRGARSINYAVVEALASLHKYQPHLVFTHQTGPDDYADIKARYEEEGFQAHVFQYIDDIPKMYAKSHLIICRAGASTVAELQASRRPAILIPYPHGDRHQEFNARALEDEGSARVILQADLSGEALGNVLVEMFQDPEALTRPWKAIEQREEKTADERLVDICLRLAQNKTRRRNFLW